MHMYRLLALVLFLVTGYHGSVATGDESLQSFWERFRQAVIHGEKEKVASMTRFPFEVRGPADFNPIIKKGRKEFIEKIYDEIISEERDYIRVGGCLIAITQLQMIQKQVQIDPGKEGPVGFAHILSLEFMKLKGRWFLTRAYLSGYD